ncbi:MULTISPECIES: glucose-6-phosphate dehydrogenase assembly protein OpcA [Prochlorococcus]|uniref:glucose-6-phosphate dehydrogenase assembly protein OpcA n=1 Tax=Prochlorococcus TaxID=1218 RepID=UPI000533AA86|nr:MULTISPECIES: glucose-6-phosphate dehydrogenase assembly protein OpcA [Prochlorococcus]KGG12232.1 OpcA [Prochlorococcus sp. MIT 0601]
MSPQLTLQTPLQLPPAEIPNYLNKLWAQEEIDTKGANTFSLLIWQPAWLEQKLVNTQKLKEPIIGNTRNEMIEAARKVVLDKDLPHSTPPFDEKVAAAIETSIASPPHEDLRGQHIDNSISDLQPRRLITLAPTIEKDHALEALVAAYCPLPEEGGGNSACGDVVVLRGNLDSLKGSLQIVEDLIPEDLPSWLWWNGVLDEDPDLFDKLAVPIRRLVLDSALGEPHRCLKLLVTTIENGQAVNDLNWLRLRTWRETLAMVFDPPDRRSILNSLTNIDIDIEGNNPVQGLLLAAWIADRLGWELQKEVSKEFNGFNINFTRPDQQTVIFRLMPLPVGKPSIHPGQIIGLRLISKVQGKINGSVCVILASESGECMRLEAGGMASMELIEEVVPIQKNSTEMDVARLLATSRGSTSPLLANAAPLATKLLGLINSAE